MSIELLLSPQHHVLVILRALVVEEGYGGGRGRPWLSEDTLRLMFTPADTLVVRQYRARARRIVVLVQAGGGLNV